MKTASILVMVSLSAASHLFAQGSLTPPGPPAPTMKTLDQIEARTPLAGGTSTITIDSPGSYFLTGNVAVAGGNGIVIAADDVALDLNGFTVSTSATVPGGSGIFLSGDRPGLHVRNGSIRGTVTFINSTYSNGGFDYGVYAVTTGGARISDLAVTGVRSGGIFAFQAAVESCVVQTSAGSGITGGAVSHCRATNCGNLGIFAATASDCAVVSMNGGIEATVATNCAAINVGAGPGIKARSVIGCSGESQNGAGIEGNSVLSSSGYSASQPGISAHTVQDSYGASNSGPGISASAAVSNSHGTSTTAAGIAAVTVHGSVGVSSFNRGISAEAVTASSGTCQGGGSFGINAVRMVTSSYGYSSSGTGISTALANGCLGQTGGGSLSVSATYKYNTP